MMGGSKKEGAQKGPPINAKDQDEEKFIQYVRHATKLYEDSYDMFRGGLY